MELINSGSIPNDGTGDTLRASVIKINNNFLEVSGSILSLSSSLSSSIGETNSKLLKKQNLPTGFVAGLQLSINADTTKYDIAEGYYNISDFSDLNNITVELKYYSGSTGNTPTYLASANATYVALDVDGNIIENSTPFTPEDRRSLCQLGAIIHSNQTTINVTNEIKAPIIAPTNQLHDLMKVIGFLNVDGNTYYANGANLKINKTAGTIFGMGINAHDYTDPHRLHISSSVSSSFRYRLQDGTEYSDVTNINPTQYDNNGVLTNLTNANRWSIQHINLFQSGLTRLQYGQHEYNSLADAEAAIKTESFNVEQNIADNSIFRCFLIVRSGATTLNTLSNAKFIPVDKFGNAVSGNSALTFETITAALGYTPADEAELAQVAFSGSHSSLTLDDGTNPHGTTKADVGLGNVDNTSDLNKPISTATSASLALKADKTYVDGIVVGLLDDRGSYNASSNVFPSTGGSGTSGAVLKGDIWYVSVAGTLGGSAVNVGDSFRALTDSPGQTASNWSILEANIGYVPANDANVVHKTDGEEIDGTKTFLKSPQFNEVPKIIDITSGDYAYIEIDEGQWNFYESPNAPDLPGQAVFSFAPNIFSMRNGNGFNSIFINSTATGNRVIAVPNMSGTLALSEFTVNTTGNQTIQGGKTFALNSGSSMLNYIQLNNNSTSTTASLVINNLAAGKAITINNNNLNGTGIEIDTTGSLNNTAINIKKAGSTTFAVNNSGNVTSQFINVDGGAINIFDSANAVYVGIAAGEDAIRFTYEDETVYYHNWNDSIANWYIKGTDTALSFDYAALTTTRNIVMPNAAGTNIIRSNSAPASPSASGVIGETFSDASFFYYCYAANSWRRVAGSTW